MKYTALIILITLLAGCEDSSSLTDEMTGKQLFESRCSECHKSSGKGKFLLGVPANANTQLTEENIEQLITQGLQSHSAMPVFEELNDKQAHLIATHLFNL